MNKKKVVLVLIILLSLFLRLYGLEYSIYDHETVDPILRSQEILSGELYLGGFGGNQSFGPLLYYVLILPLLISKTIPFIYGFLGVLNTLSVIFLYFLLKSFFNEDIALVSTLLFAVSPWHIFYSRFVWNPNFLPLFVIIFFYFVFSAYYNRSKSGFLFSIFLFMVMLNFHLSPLAFFPIILMLFYRFRLDLRLLFLGFFILFLSLVPLFIFGGFSTPMEVLNYTYSQNENTFFQNFLEAIGIPVMLSTNFYGDYIFGNIILSDFFIFVSYFGTFLGLILMTLTFIFLIRKKIKSPIILFLWLVLPVLFLLIRNKNISPHYYLILFPVVFIYEGIFISSFFKKKIIRYFLGIFILIMILSNLLLIHTISLIGGTDGAYGISYENKKSAINFALEKNANIMFIGEIPSDYYYILVEEKMLSRAFVLKEIDELNILKGYILVDDYSQVGQNFLKPHLKLVNFLFLNYPSEQIGKIKLIKV